MSNQSMSQVSKLAQTAASISKNRLGGRHVQQLLQEQTGSSAMEYMLMLSLVALGTSSLLGSAGLFFQNFFQTAIATVVHVWPS